MSRSSESVTRVDVRFSNQMYEAIQQLAIEDGARTHHISQKVEVSPTIVKLVQLGLDALAGKVPDSRDKIPDTVSDNLLRVSDTIFEESRAKIVAMIDSRLIELELITDSQSLENPPLETFRLFRSPKNIPDTVPDSRESVSGKDSSVSVMTENIPDNLSGKHDILSDSVPDNLIEPKNIPSDDSRNPLPVAEDVPIIQTEAIEPIADSSIGLNDEQMANMLSVDVGTVRRWRKGERKPSKANLNLFDRWEVRDDRWYQITTNLGNN